MPNENDSSYPAPGATWTIGEDERQVANTVIARLMYRLRHISMLCKCAILFGPGFALHQWRMMRESKKRGYSVQLVNVRRDRSGEAPSDTRQNSDS